MTETQYTDTAGKTISIGDTVLVQVRNGYSEEASVVLFKNEPCVKMSNGNYLSIAECQKDNYFDNNLVCGRHYAVFTVKDTKLPLVGPDSIL